MVQSLNLKALASLTSIIRRPYLVSPHVFVKTISDIDYRKLRDECGIRGVIFDKDNTLTAPYETTTHLNASIGLRNAISVFGIDQVAILSNSAGTKDDPNYEDAVKIERDMGINVIRHDEKKPGGLDEVMKHFEDSVIEPYQLCMIGDRLLTDIVFGNLYGMLTIHCLPLCTGKDNARDNKIASLIRPVENGALYGNWFGGRIVRNKTIPHKIWAGEESCEIVLSKQAKNVNDSDKMKSN
eukprot:CAMPEP_0194363398 /NCGR_PEP_ID=MMETSP0174-20130528/11196_1 /TAXON_ID=216777 /ORGANISM="Proboscia alata, Strain PI-D3" /LENGTH=239 /DNA_ID=CAMNT_0039136777 /DNA_START=112 /DNA_END=831 /DNA_ORIENTATION=+